MLIEHYITFTEELKSFFHSFLFFGVKNFPSRRPEKRFYEIFRFWRCCQWTIQLELIWANRKVNSQLQQLLMWLKWNPNKLLDGILTSDASHDVGNSSRVASRD